jgi:hypothetical protein
MRQTDAAPREQAAGLLLLAAIGALSFGIMHPVELSGDEHFYAAGASAIANAVLAIPLGRSLDFSGLVDTLIGNGWFMPGTSLLISPVAILAGGSAPTVVLRACILSVNLALLYLIFCITRQRYGGKVALLALAVLPLCPGYILFLSTIWSDLPGVHLALLFCLWLDTRCAEGRPHDPARAGAFIAVVTFIRGLYPPLLAVTSLVRLLPLTQFRAQRRSLPDWLWKTAAMTLVFAILISPWSLTVSERFGSTLTATSTPLSQLAMFGSKTYVPRAQIATGIDNPFFAIQRYVEQEAAREGRSFKAQAELDRDRVLQELPMSARLVVIAANMRRFFLQPNEFTDRFLDLRCKAGHCLPAWSVKGMRYANVLGWALIGISAGILVALPAAADGTSYFMSVLWKALICLICIHPLILYAHGRYFVQLVPVIAIGLGLMVSGHWRPYLFRRQYALHDAILGACQSGAMALVLSSACLIGFW